MTTPDPADRLLSIVARTRFRAPGTSSDSYTDTLLLWLSVVAEVREIVADENLHAVESVYRSAIARWLDPAGPPDTDPDDTELAERFREALD